MNDKRNRQSISPPLAALRAQLAQVCSHDVGRLLGRWRSLARAAAAEPKRIDALRADIERSQARRAARATAKPTITLDEALPISARSDDIIALIREHQIVVIAGETGSGKTTQLPKLCLAAGRGEAGLIGCTQPRRLAARSMARRVAEEVGTQLGDKVGFQVRFSEHTSDATLIKFMTDGILLAETQSDPWLSTYDTLIIDEAHERSLNIDFLLGYLKRLARRRPDLKIIVTSATIDTARFSEHFDAAPVVEVEGRAYPVEVRWQPPQDKSHTDPVVAALDDISAEDPRGDVLVFLPGEREIRDAHLALSRRQYRHTEVLALYARLSAKEQDRVFKPGPQRRIVLATNIAETSLTVPRIRWVVDAGTARVKRYSQRSQIERLHIEPVSQAAADQRKGRCGRVGPGICVRLYDEADFASRPRFTDPELLRSSLANVILRMLSLKLGEVEDFPFLDAPEPRAIADGYRRLAELSAIDDDKRLTPIGRQLARVPIDVQLARMLVEGERLQCAREVLTAVAFLSVQDPRERPPDARGEADAAHAKFADPTSDFVGMLKLWNAYTEAHKELTQSKLRDWCRRHFLSYMRMREWRELHRQLLVVMRDVSGANGFAGPGTRDPGPVEASPRKAGRRGRSVPSASDFRQSKATDIKGLSGASGFAGPGTRDPGPVEAAPRKTGRRGRSVPASSGLRQSKATDIKTAASVQPSEIASKSGPGSRVPGPENFERLHRSLLTGLPTQVGRKDEKGIYRSTRERKFQVFPGSALAKKPPNWIFCAQILDISGKVWGMLGARVEPRWIEQQAAHLLRHACHDPHWSRKRGAVVAYEQVSLFGLVLVERRAITFQKQDPALAHAVFVREALVACEIDARADFVAANAQVLGRARELEAQQRRQGLLKSDEDRAHFFEGKLPQDIASSRALDAWYRKAGAAAQASLRWSLDDVLDSAGGSDAADYPATLELAGQAYRLRYQFVPGDEADGVTLSLPLALLNALPATPCEYLVPGLLAEKVAELIRSLPKPLRRNFVPAPDFARAFRETNPPHDQPLAQALAQFLRRTTGVAIDAEVFVADALPAHLRMRFEVIDENGKCLAGGRDLAALRDQYRSRARAAFARKADPGLTREHVAEWDFDDLPACVRSDAGVDAFPALVDLGDAVALRLFEREDEARSAHVLGVERLLRKALDAQIKRASKQLPINKKLALAWAPLGRVDALREDLVQGAWADVLAEHDVHVRQRADFDALQARVGKALFAAAMARLQLAEPIIEAQAEAKSWLRAPGKMSPRSYADLNEQFDALLAPGFLRNLPAARLAHVPRYLKAMRLRGERLRQDPARDAQRMSQVAPYWAEVLKRHAAGERSTELAALRWLIEEWRVSLFAQELKTAVPVSAKRVAQGLDDLR